MCVCVCVRTISPCRVSPYIDHDAPSVDGGVRADEPHPTSRPWNFPRAGPFYPAFMVCAEPKCASALMALLGCTRGQRTTFVSVVHHRPVTRRTWDKRRWVACQHAPPEALRIRHTKFKWSPCWDHGVSHNNAHISHYRCSQKLRYAPEIIAFTQLNFAIGK